MSLNGKVVIITGASRGIGRDMAVALGEAGANVVVAARSETVPDPRLPGTIYTVAKEVEERGAKALPIKVDATKDEDVENMVAKTMETFGRIDALIYNPSVLIPGNTRTVQPRHLDLLYRLNIRAPLMTIRAVLDPIKASGGGHIIYISSRAAVFPGPGPYSEEQQARARTGGAFYGMTKAAMERYSQSLAAEVQSDNIAVNVLSPQGRIKTPGNIYAQNSRENPDLDFEEAVAMGKAARWILEQDPQTFTGNILFDEEMVAKYHL
jgi:citronellol/citronellal dehydrogenase